MRARRETRVVWCTLVVVSWQQVQVWEERQGCGVWCMVWCEREVRSPREAQKTGVRKERQPCLGGAECAGERARKKEDWW